jgi:uncharacterized protein
MKNRGTRKKRLLKWALVVLVFIGVYGTFVAPRLVDVTQHDVAIEGADSSIDGFRIVQITDMHVGSLFREGSVRRAVDLANSCKPDVVVLTGDFTSWRAIHYLPSSIKELKRLRAPHGVYACLGNHDHWENADAVRRELAKAGVKVLMNESIELPGGVRLVAVDDLMSGSPDLAKAFGGIPADRPTILMSHNPIVIDKVTHRNVLILSGHTHGGQIALPFLGPRRTIALPVVNSCAYYLELSGVKAHHGRPATVSTYKYPAGWYEKGKARMYVCRGVGSNQSPRLNCRPEIACFTLKARGGPAAKRHCAL